MAISPLTCGPSPLPASGKRFHVALALALGAAGIATLVSRWTKRPPKPSPKEVEQEVEEEVAETSFETTVDTTFQGFEKSWCEIVEEEEEMLKNKSTGMEEEPILNHSLEVKLEKLYLQEEKKKELKTGQDMIIKENPRKTDSGVVSPIDSNESHAPHHDAKPFQRPASSVCSDDFDSHSSDSQEASQNQSSDRVVLSDSGQGSEADDGTILSYHFQIPTTLCGYLIGVSGQHVRHLKTKTNCSVNLKHSKSKSKNQDGIQLCVIEGTRSGIDKCLELIREKFPLDQYPHLTLNQCNVSEELNFSGPAAAFPQLAVQDGSLRDVVVTSITNANHFFVQLLYHPTMEHMTRLQECMNGTYGMPGSISPTPSLPRPLNSGLVCVAPSTDGNWYRVQVISYDDMSDSSFVKFVDCGSYATYQASDLRQIRSDFLLLPFQAVECCLANVMQPDDGVEWPLEATMAFHDMTVGKTLKCQSIGVSPEGACFVHLYEQSLGASSELQQINRQLIESGHASWVELEVMGE